MTEETAPQTKERTQQKINEEYTLSLARLGEIHWNIEKKYPHEQDELYKKLRNLENEAVTLQNKMRQEQAAMAIKEAKAKEMAQDLKPNLTSLSEPAVAPEVN